jgi:hypothetical protein
MIKKRIPNNSNLNFTTMKKKMFITMLVLGAIGISSQLFAQETMEVTKTRTKSNQTNEKTMDQSSSVCVGKIRCGDGTCTIDFDQEIVSPRDAASGLPTGKRMHKPFTITMELDKNAPAAVRESPTKASTGKVSYSDLSIMVTSKGKSKKLEVVNGQFTLPSDGKDNDCDVICSWSFGGSHASTSAVTKDSGISRYQATFNLKMEEGLYMAPKQYIGHVTLMK